MALLLLPADPNRGPHDWESMVLSTESQQLLQYGNGNEKGIWTYLENRISKGFTKKAALTLRDEWILIEYLPFVYDTSMGEKNPPPFYKRP